MANKYTAKQFIKAIPGTGGVKQEIADRVGCDWHTVDRYIEEYQTIKQAYLDEKSRITDKAKSNIISAIEDRGDLQMSKWWLQVMDEEFVPRERREVTGADGGKIIVSISD